MATHSQSSKHCDVSATSSLRLDDKDSVPTCTSRLLDRVARLDKHVDGGVRPDAPFRDGDIVGNCSRQVHDRNVESIVLFATFLENLKCRHGFKPANDEQRVELVLFELGRDAGEISVGQGAVRAELGSTASRPLVDAKPAAGAEG